MISKELLKTLEKDQEIRSKFRNGGSFLNKKKIKLNGQKHTFKFIHPVTKIPVSSQEYSQIKRKYLRSDSQWTD